MRRITKVGIAAVSALALLGIAVLGGRALSNDPVRAEEKNEMVRQIEVQGQGQAEVQPDRATINLTVRTEHDEAKQASAENAEKMRAVIAALEEAGLESDDIQTAGYEIETRYDYENNKPVFAGYTALNHLTVLVRDLAKVGEILDIAVDAGANLIQGITFSVEDSSASYAQALEAATKDAEAKAKTLAEASGIASTLRPNQIIEISYSPTPMMRYEAQTLATTDAATPIQRSKISVVATVKISYSFEID